MWVFKLFGGFAACRFCTRHHIRILCYHGSSAMDEHEFRPKLFMSPELFRRRMTWLRSSPYNVVPLESLTSGDSQQESEAYRTIITFDDGFYGTLERSIPVLEELGLPATVYVTSYYVKAGTPVFNVLVPYLFWKSTADELDLARVHPDLDGIHSVQDPDGAAAAVRKIVDYGDANLNSDGRNELAKHLAEELGLNWPELCSRRVCSLMNLAELREAVSRGIDVQLHTHRHRYPLGNPTDIAREIDENRAVLKEAGARNLVHFCYPSGVWSPELFSTLDAAGVRTATTCDRGLNAAKDHPLALRRFLDGEDVSQIEFEAYLSGAYELLDWLVGKLQRLLGRSPAEQRARLA